MAKEDLITSDSLVTPASMFSISYAIISHKPAVPSLNPEQNIQFCFLALSQCFV